MTKQMPDGALIFKREVKTALKEILDHKDTSPGGKEFIQSIYNFADDSGFLTQKQASKAGEMHTAIVTKGYVRNGWWKKYGK